MISLNGLLTELKSLVGPFRLLTSGARIRELVDALISRLGHQDEEIADRDKEIARLRSELSKEKRGKKRQAAPFSKGPPKKDPDKPGRKKGKDYGRQGKAKMPRKIDERISVPIPDVSGCCGAAVHGKGEGNQYQIDLPKIEPYVVEFVVGYGKCSCCGKRVQGRDPRQISDALNIGNVQFGPNVIAVAAELNKTCGLSFEKIAKLYAEVFNLEIDRSTLARMLDRLAKKAEPTADSLRDELRNAMVAYLDETGWRIGGKSAWLHVATTLWTTVYLVASGRGFDEAAQLIGEDFDNVLVTDGWAPYRRFENAIRQTCITHLLGRCRRLLDAAGSEDEGLFPNSVRSFLKDALRLRDRRDAEELSAHGLATARGILEKRLDRLLEHDIVTDEDRKLQNHLEKWQDAVLVFLYATGIEPGNWPAEQEIRPATRTRKMVGGNRTERGAEIQSTLMTVMRTAVRRSISPIRVLAEIMGQPTPTAHPIQ